VAVGTERLHIGSRDHVVQFYGDDTELIEEVGDFLQGVVTQGGVAVLIAAREHRKMFSRRLTEAGIDVVEARSRGRYLDVDVDEAVRGLMVGGRPNRARFQKAVGGLIRTTVRTGRRVRGYGEMVAVRWNSGLANAALELGSLRNGLVRRYSFSLSCAYPAADREHFEALPEVCFLHGKVVGVLDSGIETREFALTSDAPALARRFAVSAVERLLGNGSAGGGPGGGPVEYTGIAEDVAIVATELAANAALHARTDFTVALSCRQDVVRISVRDFGPVVPLVAEVMHGLGVVSALAKSWGVTAVGDGKAIWAELDSSGSR
jgi:MEDS: MEthanogen/methylotroph, DcmR Sensory domain